jgi:hypothetical protein
MLKVPASERDQIHEAGDADQISRWEGNNHGPRRTEEGCGSKRKKTGGKIKYSGLRRGARSRVVLGAGCWVRAWERCFSGSACHVVVSCRVVSRARSNQVGYSRISMREIFGEETEIYLKKSGLRPKALEIIPVSAASNERR